jgi:putative spermidine/putrescine transport system substrate-binding protein
MRIHSGNHVHSGRHLALVGALAGLLLAACGSSSKSTGGAANSTAAPKPAATTAAAKPAATTAAAAKPATTAAPKPAASTAAPSGGASGDLKTLVDAAKKEGQVNLIALPDSWANYKGILESFRTKYGIKDPVANPEGSSADELTAVKNTKGQKDMPDAIDVGPPFAIQAIQEKLVTPFKPSVWAEIPDNLKDPDGNWVGAYYGIMSLGANKNIVKNPPKTWADLLKPEYKGQVALNGDPREAGAAFAAVVAASLANGGSFDNIGPGIDFFAKLKGNGNFIPLQVTEATVLSGETPIAIDWTYNFPGLQDKLKAAGVEMAINIPTDGVYGSYYAQSVVAGGPNPNAGKLWIEHLVSDDGALGYLQGGAIPARFASLVKAGKVPDALKANLPSEETIKKVQFPNKAQLDAMKKTLTEQWGPKVAGN